MSLTLVDEERRPVRGAYVVRLVGWTLERYLQQAPSR